MAFLVQMRQSNKCGNVRNNETLNLHLGSSVCPISCKALATFIEPLLIVSKLAF